MSFTYELLTRLQQATLAECDHNWDHHRFGPERWTRRMNTLVRRAAKWLGFGPYRWVHQIRPDALERWKPVLPDLEWLTTRLGDDESRRWLVDLIAYRWLGPRAVQLPTNTPEYWATLRRLEQLRLNEPPRAGGLAGWQLEAFDLNPLGYPLTLYSRPANLMAQFVLEQYACPRLGVQARPGAVVIDGGGCYGDTALYFADRVGAAGRVYSFEFVASNLELYRANLARNPELAGRIEICPHPLWSQSDLPLYVVDRGPASTVHPERPAAGSAQQVSTLSIDDLVARQGLPRVDLLKLDIEGAEFETLHGAQHTIRRFRPQLAVCVYHSPQDFVRLARYIDELVPEYRLALGHFTIHAEETVLFASCDGSAAAAPGQHV